MLQLFVSTAPTPVSLNFSENVLDGFEDQVVDANLPFKKDISVEIHDVSGWVITDGPDASLAVVAELDPSTACLSNDAGFTLVNGVGVFLGSICELGQNIRIQFSVTTSLNQTLYTGWTPLFNVTGELVHHLCPLSVHECVCVHTEGKYCMCVVRSSPTVLSKLFPALPCRRGPCCILWQEVRYYHEHRLLLGCSRPN